MTARRFPLNKPRDNDIRTFFELSGQLPLRPPNVGGFPDPDNYLTTTATIARINMAAQMVDRSYAPIIGDDFVDETTNLGQLAFRLGLIDGFAPATIAALQDREPGFARLAAALASPDVLVV